MSVTATDLRRAANNRAVTYTVLDFTPPTISLRAPTDGATLRARRQRDRRLRLQRRRRRIGNPVLRRHILERHPTGYEPARFLPIPGVRARRREQSRDRERYLRVVDSIPPAIAIKTPPDGVTYGLGDNVTVNYTCSDSGSGVQSCAGTRPSGTQLDTGHLGSFTFQVAATDVAGNTASASTTYRVVDRTPPSIVITTPANGARTRWARSSLRTMRAPMSQTARGSRHASATSRRAHSSNVERRQPDVHGQSGRRAQNSATASSAYRVIYDFSGFFPPVAAFPTGNQVKAGEGIPLKFSLHGNRGNDVLASGSPTWTPCDQRRVARRRRRAPSRTTRR